MIRAVVIILWWCRQSVWLYRSALDDCLLGGEASTYFGLHDLAAGDGYVWIGCVRWKHNVEVSCGGVPLVFYEVDEEAVAARVEAEMDSWR